MKPGPSDASYIAITIWPRISPAGFFVVWTFTYVAPPLICASCASVIMPVVPVWPEVHGPQSGISGAGFATPRLPA